jgi:uncharacterized glyoxalase superfamily protein PhnB
MSLAFGCDSPADVHRLYGDLVAAGYEATRSHGTRVLGDAYAVLHDPEGNGVDMFCPTAAR